MKRLRILTKPTAVADLKDIDIDNLTNNWQFRAERLEVRRWRKFKQQLA